MLNRLRAAARERLSGANDDEALLSTVDMAWLRMERPENLMNVTAMFSFDHPVSREEVVEVLEARLLTIPRFRARLAAGTLFGRPRWVNDEAIDLRYHIPEIALPAPGDDAALRTVVGELMSRQLDRTRPLWQFHVIQNHRGGTSVLCRVHHSLGDGIALMLVFLSLTDMDPGRPDHPNPLARLFAPGQASLEEAKSYIRRLMPTGMKLLLHKDHFQVAGREVHNTPSPDQVLEVGKDLASLVLRWPDTPNRFHGDLGTKKRAAWSRPYPLEDIKALRGILGGTVNDVVVTATAGALRRYLISCGDDPSGQDVRATIPVNLRRLEGIPRLGNVFGLVFLDLPVGIEDPKRRLVELVDRTRALKRSPEALVTFGILSLIGWVPAAVETAAVHYFSARSTAVMTNVPGPERPVHFGHHEVADISFWVPQSGDIGLGISIGSYAGQLKVGFACDARLIPDPQALADAFEQELDALMALGRTT